MEEIWKTILQSEHYQVSNLGRVKSLGFDYIRSDGLRTVSFEKVLKTCFNKSNGYVSVVIRINKKPKTFYVHRLVATAFLDNNDPLKEVNHIDGIKTNNHYLNLEWVTRQQNHKHRFEILRQIPNRKGVFNSNGSKPVVQKDINGNVLGNYLSACEASRITNTNRSSLHGALNGTYKTAGGFTWSYLIFPEPEQQINLNLKTNK